MRTAAIITKFTTISAFALLCLWAWHRRAWAVGAIATLFLCFMACAIWETGYIAFGLAFLPCYVRR